MANRTRIDRPLPRLNQIVNCDCREGLRSLPDESVPLTVTSPPWDDLRTFEESGSPPWSMAVFREVADELWRVTSDGGVVCWHVGERVKDGSESGTSSEQRLYFRDIGFKLWQTLAIETSAGRSQPHRYGMLQHVFVLSKGRPRTVELLRDRKNKTAGTVCGFVRRNPDGSIHDHKLAPIAEYGQRGPVWVYGARRHDEEAKAHPSAMNEELARDLILSFSRPGDLVLDPFAGTGTTPKRAMLAGRHFLGFETVESFCQLAKKRLVRHRKMMRE